MQRHKMFARIVLLILSVISFAIAALVLVRGTREDMVDIAGDVTTAAMLADNTPQSLGSSDSDHHPRSPMARDSNAFPRQNDPTDPESDNSHPLPVDLPTTAHNNLPSWDLNKFPQESAGVSGSPTHSTNSTGNTYRTSLASMSPWTWEMSNSPSLSPSHDSNPPLRHGNLDVFYNRPLSP